MIAVMRQLILSVTAASLFGAVVLALVPNSALKETVRLGVGLVLILALVLPLRSLLPFKLTDLLPESTEVQQEETDSVYRAAVKEQVEVQTAEYIVQQAAQNGISCTAQVSADIAEDGTVSIQTVTIQTEDDTDDSQLQSLQTQLSTQLGVSKDCIWLE